MNEYKIKLNGLKDGSYSNSFTIKGEFFEAFNTSEIKYVNIDIDTILKVKNKSFSLEDVKSYLKTFFKKIEESNFPLGHKYVDFEKESESKDVADFSKICKNLGLYTWS